MLSHTLLQESPRAPQFSGEVPLNKKGWGPEESFHWRKGRNESPQLRKLPSSRSHVERGVWEAPSNTACEPESKCMASLNLFHCVVSASSTLTVLKPPSTGMNLYSLETLGPCVLSCPDLPWHQGVGHGNPSLLEDILSTTAGKGPKFLSISHPAQTYMIYLTSAFQRTKDPQCQTSPGGYSLHPAGGKSPCRAPSTHIDVARLNRVPTHPSSHPLANSSIHLFSHPLTHLSIIPTTYLANISSCLSCAGCRVSREKTRPTSNTKTMSESR